MRKTNGPRSDPITQDIRDAVRRGHFDTPVRSPLLEKTVEELLAEVALMSPAARRAYLRSLSRMPGDGTQPYLSGQGRTATTKTRRMLT